MKITQPKNYKKPLYAIGLAAAIMAASLTGCTDDLQIAGEMTVWTDPTDDNVHEIVETITAGIVSITFK